MKPRGLPGLSLIARPVPTLARPVQFEGLSDRRDKRAITAQMFLRHKAISASSHLVTSPPLSDVARRARDRGAAGSVERARQRSDGKPLASERPPRRFATLSAIRFPVRWPPRMCRPHP